MGRRVVGAAGWLTGGVGWVHAESHTCSGAAATGAPPLVLLFLVLLPLVLLPLALLLRVLLLRARDRMLERLRVRGRIRLVLWLQLHRAQLGSPQRRKEQLADDAKGDRLGELALHQRALQRSERRDKRVPA